jgi:hypothetical protein
MKGMVSMKNPAQDGIDAAKDDMKLRDIAVKIQKINGMSLVAIHLTANDFIKLGLTKNIMDSLLYMLHLEQEKNER